VKYTRPRGTQDVVPPAIDTWRGVERVFDETFGRYGYRGIRTPIFESTDLFVRAVGEGTDIVSKEMYTFTDRGGRSLTLRPENTASVIRAYLENGLHRAGGIQRLCYTGPMFRYDRPQAGRYRQFHQVGAEAIGSDNPAVDAEMIQLVMDAFGRLGFTGADLRLNSVGTEASRGPYREVLRKAIAGRRADVPGIERYLDNPLRVFDAKEVDGNVKRSLPTISSHLVGTDGEHFARVKALLADTGIPFTEDPYLVRGLDYYTKTVFEVYYGAHGAQSALCGGGRYDNLVEECGGPATPAIGFSAGLERIIAALPAGGDAAADGGAQIRYYVACVGDGAAARALKTGAVVRRHGNALVDLSGRSRKKQLQVAEKSGACVAVVVDEDEPDAITWRDLAGHADTMVPEAELAAFVARQQSTEGHKG
jgi:histidyl-tRNA synthetase